MQRETLFQLFKYAVYALLTANVFIFFVEEHAAAQLQFADGLQLGQWIEAYVATIDTAAWVILLLMFELETYVLDDDQLTPPVVTGLHALRVVSYSFVVYSFYGYVVNLIFTSGATLLPGVDDLCTLVADNWSYAVDLDEYELLTAANCGSYSQAAQFLQLPGMPAVVDDAGLTEIYRLAWVDVINAAVWILVVIVLEIDVWLQENDRLVGVAASISTVTKFILYATLFLAAVYWGFKGDFVDFWDAFLWLVAFFFIEMNVIEWRQETREQQAAAVA